MRGGEAALLKAIRHWHWQEGWRVGVGGKMGIQKRDGKEKRSNWGRLRACEIEEDWRRERKNWDCPNVCQLAFKTRHWKVCVHKCVCVCVSAPILIALSEVDCNCKLLKCLETPGRKNKMSHISLSARSFWSSRSTIKQSLSLYLLLLTIAFGYMHFKNEYISGCFGEAI